uniref:Uncharacterized protein n=1 Tax=Glossina pallidipes TaxID=7398 RepID=A0A1A9ZEJ6_GLOPL
MTGFAYSRTVKLRTFTNLNSLRNFGKPVSYERIRKKIDNGDVLRMLPHITEKTNYGKHYAVKDKQHEFDYLQRHFKVMLHSLHYNDRMERMEFTCSIQLRYKFCSLLMIMSEI